RQRTFRQAMGITPRQPAKSTRLHPHSASRSNPDHERSKPQPNGLPDSKPRLSSLPFLQLTVHQWNDRTLRTVLTIAKICFQNVRMEDECEGELSLRLHFRSAVRPVRFEFVIRNAHVSIDVPIPDDEVIARTRLKKLLLQREPCGFV